MTREISYLTVLSVPEQNPGQDRTDGWVLCSFSSHTQDWDPHKISVQRCQLCKSHCLTELGHLSAPAYQHSVLSEHNIKEPSRSIFCRGSFQEPRSFASNERNKNS